MRLLIRAAFLAAFAGWALVTLYVFVWLRERWGRGGPIPVSQAQILLHPLRRWMQPARATLEKFGIRPGGAVLEIGPGPGYFTLEAARMVGASGRMLALDVQRGMLAMLQQRLDGAGARDAHPILGDATCLPLRDGTVDVAFLVAVLGEIPDRPAALAELRRVLKPGGLLGITETLTDPDYQLAATVRDVCRASGFEPVEHSRERTGYTTLFRAPARDAPRREASPKRSVRAEASPAADEPTEPAG
jgi:SAM-dependent methyltransferase